MRRFNHDGGNSEKAGGDGSRCRQRPALLETFDHGRRAGWRPARDSVAPLAFWLASSSIAQVCAAALFIGGSALWLRADLAKSRLAQQEGLTTERDREEARVPA